LARACEERVDVMAVTGLNRPDFRTISDFRKRHLAALSALFVQVAALLHPRGRAWSSRVVRLGARLRLGLELRLGGPNALEPALLVGHPVRHLVAPAVDAVLRILRRVGRRRPVKPVPNFGGKSRLLLDHPFVAHRLVVLRKDADPDFP
jgi:hypothetical protein